MVCRALGWLSLAIAVAVVARDALAWWTEGDLHLLRLGELGSQLGISSLSDPDMTVQGDLSVSLWDSVARPILALPALFAFLVLGVLLLWLGNRSPAVEPDLLTGSRPPRRRRRNRGGLG